MAKLNFKEVQSQCATLLSTLKGGVYAPIYLLMGEEPYYIDLISDYIQEHALDVADRDFNQMVIYGKDTTGGQVVGQARRYPMMSSRQVVLVREAQAMAQIEELVHYVNAPLSSTVLVLCYKGKSLDKRSVLYKKLVASKAIIMESVAPRDYEISGWVSQMVASKGRAIEHKAVAMIVDFIGADLAKIEGEIDKLLTRLDSSTKTITPDMVEQNIGISKDYNNFELTKALSMRDIKQALNIAQHFAANPKDNPLMVTTSVLFNHFQRIVALNIYKWEAKQKKIPLPSETEIAKLLGLAHSFFVQEYMTASQNYPNSKAFPILGLIREWEMKSKGMGAGSADQGELLKELILRIALV